MRNKCLTEEIIQRPVGCGNEIWLDIFMEAFTLSRISLVISQSWAGKEAYLYECLPQRT
uniref:Uncharacterized protein n=1 Tax=Arundo donax TaxID=35708 RepID=A0A0A9AQX2_ARUDO